MSHATGAVRFPDGEIMFYEYNGTSDVCLPQLYKTYEELHANWRRRDWIFHYDKNCNEDVQVEIASSYGGGFAWLGKACKKHMMITDRLSILDHDEVMYHDKLPEWFPNYELYK